MAKIMNPWRRWGRRVFVPILALTLVGLFVGTAQAVHDESVFQLDGNAQTSVAPTGITGEDWDLICKAHPTTCTFSGATPVPSGTTVASPSAFIVDPSQSSTDDILKGGTKDDNNMNTWSWASAKPSPPKNDLTDGYAAEYTCKGSETNSVSGCTGTTGDKLLYFGADRLSNNGSANVAFWFFQKKVLQKADGTGAAAGTCVTSSGCPFVGSDGTTLATHTVGNCSLPSHPLVCTPGDILIISAFGPKAQIFVYEWVGAGKATKNYLGTNSCFTAACSLQPLFVGSTSSDCPDVTNDNACAVTNDSASVPSPWVVPQAGAPNNTFATTDFFEGGINLTALGLGSSCLSSFLINSRASAAGDAELHDKILGQFARCVPNVTTQASTNGTVQPGTSVHDTATVTVTGALAPDDATGTITFYLCGPNASAAPDCSTGGTKLTPDGTLTDSTSNTHDGISAADSPNVNTTGSPLDNGYYCFRAEAHLTNYDSPDPVTNTTTECFRVLQLSTSIVTDPQSPAGATNTGPFALADNAQVYDHAIVTGNTAGGSPTGHVDFFICTPSQVTGAAGSEICPATAGTQVGTSVTVTAIALSNPPQTEATSNAAVTANALGVWCFRATYTPDTAVYTGISGGDHSECFTVRTTSAASSLQNWLPNDSATISTAGNVALNGTLSIKLLSGSCDPADTGTVVVFTEPTNQTVTNVASPHTFTTTNTGTVVTAANNATPYFWRIVFTPSNALIDPITKCEKTDITINNSP